MRSPNSRRSKLRLGVSSAVLAVLFLALGIALPASGAPPSVSQKQAQAQQILGEIESLDSDLNRAVESYNGARLHLAKTQAAIRSNTFTLHVTRQNLKRSQQTIAERVRTLYMNDDQQSTIEIVLGAKTLDEVVSGIDAAEQVTRQDLQIAREVETFRNDVEARQKTLIADRKRATALVAEAESKRNEIESSISRRQQLLSQVKDEIARMQAAERQRQLQVAAQVRARLAAQATQARAARTPTDPAASTPQNDTAAPPTPSPAAPAPTDTASTPSASPPPSRYSGVVGIAMRYLGIPYKWGGASPSGGFDCSGFTMYVYAQIGVSLPHYTGDQWRMGVAVSREDLQPGDLVFFDGLGHEGMYIGGGQFIHAPHTGDVVKISPMSGWYAQTYMGARRL